jgi:hypothetical protein
MTPAENHLRVVTPTDGTAVPVMSGEQVLELRRVEALFGLPLADLDAGEVRQVTLSTADVVFLEDAARELERIEFRILPGGAAADRGQVRDGCPGR